MFVQVFETHQVFETGDYLAIHLLLISQFLRASVFMYYFCTFKFLERDSKNCVLETWIHGFHYTKQANVMECSVRSL